MSEQLTLNLRLNETATFGNFVGGVAVRLQAAHGLVVLAGLPGTGKSHLLQALCHTRAGAIYLGDIKGHQPAVLAGLGHQPLVCIDDCDYLFGNEDWEVALFGLVNGMAAAGGTLVLAMADIPASQPIDLADLASRVRAAQILETPVLGDEEKRDLLQQLATRRGFALPTDVVTYILNRGPRDTGGLVASLRQIEQESLRQQRLVTIPFARQVLAL